MEAIKTVPLSDSEIGLGQGTGVEDSGKTIDNLLSNLSSILDLRTELTKT